MSNGATHDLTVALREAGAEELERLVEGHLESLDVVAVRHLLRNPHLGLAVIELLLTQRRLLVFQEVRGQLVRHPRTPEVHALRFVGGLFWRDLLEIVGDTRVRPRVRRAAERHLVNRLAGLAVGERMSIARRASPLLVSQLRQDPEPRVIEALLENPRLTEGGLMPLVSSETTRPKILATIARHGRWGLRYPIRLALCRNRRTPVQTVLGLLPLLKKHDLVAVAQDRRLPAATRRRATVLLGRTPP